jgi:glycosyltransferase involved in cell wall biosynthesis
MSFPSTSVVIPVRNGARHLAEAVASVRAQTAPVTEVIIVDDGSTDDTPAVIAALPGVRALRQEPAGAAAARNRGAEAATGKWLAFLDADDLWTPDKIARQFAWLAAHPETDVVFGHGANFITEPEGARREEPPRPAYLPGAALLRRAFFLERARFETERGVSEAIAWYLRLCAGGARIGVLPELVLRRRVHDANSRRQGDGGRATDLKLVREHLARRRAGRG